MVSDNITGEDRGAVNLPAIGNTDGRCCRGTAFQHAELVEQKVGMSAVAVEMPFQEAPSRPAWVGLTELSVFSEMCFSPGLLHIPVTGAQSGSPEGLLAGMPKALLESSSASGIQDANPVG